MPLCIRSRFYHISISVPFVWIIQEEKLFWGFLVGQGELSKQKSITSRYHISVLSQWQDDPWIENSPSTNKQKHSKSRFWFRLNGIADYQYRASSHTKLNQYLPLAVIGVRKIDLMQYNRNRSKPNGPGRSSIQTQRNATKRETTHHTIENKAIYDRSPTAGNTSTSQEHDDS